MCKKRGLTSYLVQEAELVLGLGVQNLHLKENNSLFSFFGRFAFTLGLDRQRGRHYCPVSHPFVACGL